MRRRGFTFVTVVAFMGTLAIGVALVQTDTALTAYRFAAHAQAHLRAQLAGASLGAALAPGAAGAGELPGVKASAEARAVTVEVSLRGRPVVVVVPR